MKDSKSDVVFIGGFKGVSKSSGKPFFGLSFATSVKHDDTNHVGWDVANIFVDESTWNDFANKGQPMQYINANLLFARGGWILLNYNF